MGIKQNVMSLIARSANKGRNFVREWRKHRSLSQEQLAAITGYTPSSISQLETGSQGYSEESLTRIAQALDCRPADLITGPLSEIALLDKLKDIDPARRAKIINALNEMLATLLRLGG